ncbi:MAG: hypothetical protein JAY98_03495 [Candidatus Thiodiazotropha lotti]|nr:hypothetical protein [Candidatus Thiodiazotropha lotti]MCW4182238.1 hypothetical protein [Candidatus Thiodiazotropha weberae]
MKGLLAISIITVPMLTGCAAYVTKENSATFDTWELCTLLYEPHSLYSSWTSMEEEDSVIREELKKRGFLSKADCSIESIAKAKCNHYGFTSGTTEYAKCRMDVEHHIKEMKQMKKSAQDATEAAEAIQAQQIQNSIQQQQIIHQQQWQLQQNQMKPWWSW